MPQIETWSHLPVAVRDHLIDRMRDRKIGLNDLNKLRIWMESKPEVPAGPWYKDFGSFKLCGEGKYPKTFLLPRTSRHWAETLSESIYFFEFVWSNAARRPFASFTASSFAQKCMKNSRGCSSSMWLCSAVTWMPLPLSA